MENISEILTFDKVRQRNSVFAIGVDDLFPMECCLEEYFQSIFRDFRDFLLK